VATLPQSFEVPYRDKVLDNEGLLTMPWEWFFRALWERLNPLGAERSFDLENNQGTAANIDGMKFKKNKVSQATIEYLVQRVTTGGSATELVESGILIATYNPTSEDWNLHAVDENNPEDAGITFSITSDGQVQYTSSNVTGDASISRIVWRARTMGAKISTYSTMGKT